MMASTYVMADITATAVNACDELDTAFVAEE
jgi:hypothetical protein